MHQTHFCKKGVNFLSYLLIRYLCIGNFEPGRRHINIRFLAPVKLRSGDYSFKYSLLRPGGVQKWGLFIQIFAFLPRYDLEVDSIHSLIGILKYT